MGAVYSVYFKYKVKDQEKAYATLKGIMDKGETTNGIKVDFGVQKFADEGVDVNSWEGLLQIVFAGWKSSQYKTRIDGHKRNVVENHFDACYGWEGVMIDVFYALAPYLADNTSLEIQPDNELDYFVIKDGKVEVRA